MTKPIFLLALFAAAYAAESGALDDLVGAQIAQLAAMELLRDDAASVTLTRRGKCLADAIVTELLKG